MPSIGPQFTQRNYSWTAWKAVLAVKRAQHQYENGGDRYAIWFYDGPEVHTCEIWAGDVPHEVVSGGYSQVQNDLDKADFITNYQATANARIAQGQAPTSSVTNVAASVAAVTIMAANVARVGGLIFNDGNGTLYLKLGTAASSTSHSVQIKGAGYYEVPYFYTGIITGSWSVANGSARVTEVLL